MHCQNGKEEKKNMNEDILMKNSQINQNVKNEEKTQKIKKEQLSVRSLFFLISFFLSLSFFRIMFNFCEFSFYNRVRKQIVQRKLMKKRLRLN